MQHSIAEQFVRDGYVVVDNLVSADDRAAVVADAARFATGDYPVINPPQLVDGCTDDDALRQVLAVHFPHWVSEVALSMVRHRGITDVVGSVAGAHLAHWDGAVKCCQSMLFVKGPGMPGQAWHQDERFIPTRDRSLVGAWIALDDATVDNGCLWVLPGSHRTGYLWPTRTHQSADYDLSDESYGFDDSGAVPVEVTAGSVVFFNGYLLHRSLANRTDGYRRALVNHYLNGWSLLPWYPTATIRGSEVGMLDNRTVVPIGPDPYADRGCTPPPKAVFVRPVAESEWPDTSALNADLGADRLGVREN